MNNYEIETYVENDQKKAYHFIYLDSLLNMVDEIILPLSFQYNYASTILNANKGILLVRSIPVLEQGKPRCNIKFYLSNGGEDKLIKESLVEGSNFFSPLELKELKDGKVLLIGTYGAINENDGSSKIGSTEQVALILDIASIGGTATIDHQQLQSFNIVPNPVNQYFSIASDIAFDDVFIYNLEGKMLVQKRTSDHTFDFSAYPSGLYFCELRNHGNTIGRQKFVKIE